MENNFDSFKFIDHVIQLYRPENHEMLLAERAEQEKLRNMNMVPRTMIPDTATFESLGFKFKDIEGDSAFCTVTIPNGWHMPSSYDFGKSYICDEKGRKRASIELIANTPNPYGKMTLLCRYKVSTDFDVTEREDAVVAVDTTNDAKLYCSPYVYHMLGETLDKYWNEAEEFLDANYPNWRDPLQYWD